jgi:hypothetical protein
MSYLAHVFGEFLCEAKNFHILILMLPMFALATILRHERGGATRPTENNYARQESFHRNDGGIDSTYGRSSHDRHGRGGADGDGALLI